MSRYERVQLCVRVGTVVASCERWDIPLVLEPVIMGAPRTEEVAVQEEKVARIAYDLGAHIVKIAFPGEERTKRLSEELKVPLVIAGDPLFPVRSPKQSTPPPGPFVAAPWFIVGRNVRQRDRKIGEETIVAIAELTRSVKF